MAEVLKNQGNDLFGKADYHGAIKSYSDAITEFGASSVLLSNRAAAHLMLNQFPLALEDSHAAILLDSKNSKAYFRKAKALAEMGDERGSYITWKDCVANCEMTSVLKKHVNEATERWLHFFRTVAVVDCADFKERFKLIPETRERLSTLVHFWNESSNEDRLRFFRAFLSLVSGDGGMTSDYEDATPRMMLTFPLGNYEDLPKDRIPAWITFFAKLNSDDKTELLRNIYGMLSIREQTAVVADLKLVVGAGRTIEEAETI